MRSHLGSRLLQVIPTILLVSVLVFALQQLMPGDPATILAGESRGDPAIMAQIRADLWLDRPLPVQYLHWIGGVLHGNLGRSWRLGEPVLTLIGQKLPVTMQLASMAFAIALLIGVPAGVLAAVYRNTVWDYVVNLIGLAGLSTPNFWLGIMLILFVSVKLGWLPPSGYVPLTEDWRQSLATTIMPAFVLGNAIAAVLMRHTRSAMLTVLDQDYVRTARAKGLSEIVVVVLARVPQCVGAGGHAGGARVRDAAVGRGVDGAGVQYSGFRQADRRCRVQPRLPGGAGRGAGHVVLVHPAQSVGRCALCPDQPAAAVGMSETMVRSPIRLAMRRFRGRPAAVAGLVVITLFVLLAVLAPWVTQYNPDQTSWTTIRKAPSLLHWMGTDENGRDVFARVVFGARASLLAGVISVLIAAGIGVPLGLLAGFAGGVTDAVIGRFVDAMLSCPFLILAIALTAFLGPALSNAMIAIGVSAAPIFVRVARGATMDAATNDYVEAARALGNPPWRVAVRHVLPNIVPPVLVQATLAIATAIIAEASLSFLGLGQQPPAPSWGSMLNSAQRFLTQAPWLAIFPGLAIFLAVLSFNLIGDGLRDALDPRRR